VKVGEKTRGVRVLGVDPGSNATGWALVVAKGNRYELESAGVVRPRKGSRCLRLADLQDKLAAVVEQHAPDCAAVESSFSGLNPKSGIALAESRGVILAVLGHRQLAVSSYTPAQVKSAVVGHGQAEKQQVNYMVVRLLGLSDPPPADAADAMAVAITHLHSTPTKKLVDAP
jgi:crossover junction endodeoxyribonuclease RuvC